MAEWTVKALKQLRLDIGAKLGKTYCEWYKKSDVKPATLVEMAEELKPISPYAITRWLSGSAKPNPSSVEILNSARRRLNNEGFKNTCSRIDNGKANKQKVMKTNYTRNGQS